MYKTSHDPVKVEMGALIPLDCPPFLLPRWPPCDICKVQLGWPTHPDLSGFSTATPQSQEICRTPRKLGQWVALHSVERRKALVQPLWSIDEDTQARRGDAVGSPIDSPCPAYNWERNPATLPGISVRGKQSTSKSLSCFKYLSYEVFPDSPRKSYVLSSNSSLRALIR